MATSHDSPSNLLGKIIHYLELRAEVVRLRGELLGSRLLTSGLLLGWALLLALFVAIFAGLALAFWLGAWFGSVPLGMLAVAGIALLKLASLLIFRKGIQSRMGWWLDAQIHHMSRLPAPQAPAPARSKDEDDDDDDDDDDEHDEDDHDDEDDHEDHD